MNRFRYVRHIRVSSASLERLRGEVKKEFLKHNPQFEGLPLPDGFLIEKVLLYYLDRDPEGSL